MQSSHVSRGIVHGLRHSFGCLGNRRQRVSRSIARPDCGRVPSIRCSTQNPQSCGSKMAMACWFSGNEAMRPHYQPSPMVSRKQVTRAVATFPPPPQKVRSESAQIILWRPFGESPSGSFPKPGRSFPMKPKNHLLKWPQVCHRFNPIFPRFGE